MKHMHRVLLMILAGLISASGITSATQYKAYSLAPQGATACPYYVNNHGDVVIARQINGQTSQIAIYNPITQTQSNWSDIIYGGWGDVKGINDQGHVLLGGRAELTSDGNYYERGAIWDPVNGLKMLSYDGAMGIHVTGINNSDQIIGQSNPQGISSHDIYLWDSSHGMENIGSYGDYFNYAVEINNAGQIVGNWESTNNTWGGFVWGKTSGFISITQPSIIANALSINDNGLVTGTVNDSATNTQSIFLWDAANGYRVIYSKSFSTPSIYDLAINDGGVIAGDMEMTQAFVWDNVNGMQYLDGRWAFDINNAGMVVGVDMNWNNVLWVPIPEPSSLLALSFGLLPMGLGLARRRYIRN